MIKKIIVEIILLILSEINKDLTNALTSIKQPDSTNLKISENIRSLEQPLSLLIDILISLIHNKKIGYFKDFINCEVIYILTQVNYFFISLFLFLFLDHLY